MLGWGWSPIVASMERDGTEQFYEQEFSAAVGLYVDGSYFESGMVYAPTYL